MNKDNQPNEERVYQLKEAFLEQAENLLKSATVVLEELSLPNIAYHLAVLALEEIGKAGLIISKFVVGDLRDSTWIDKRLEDHETKIFFALWTPDLGNEQVSLQAFEETRKLAKRIHFKRLESLYVSTSGSSAPSPLESVTVKDAKTILELARSRLEIEKLREFSPGANQDESIKLFLSQIDDPRKLGFFFNETSLKKLAELNGNAKEWFSWVQSQIEYAENSARNALEKEKLRPQPKGVEAEVPKWRMTVKIDSLSHSIRPGVIKEWNKLVSSISLRPAGSKKNAFYVDLTLSANVPIEGIWGAGINITHLLIASLNIGAMGHFWLEAPNLRHRYFEKIIDLQSGDNFEVLVRPSKNSFIEWPPKALSLEDIYRSARCFSLLYKMQRDREHNAVQDYILAVTLYSKSDAHIVFMPAIAVHFLRCLRRSLQYLGFWDGSEKTFESSFHQSLELYIPSRESRIEILTVASNLMARDGDDPSDITLEDALKIKAACDIVLILGSRNTDPISF